MSAETITVVLSAIGIVVTFGAGMFSLGAWILRRLDAFRVELKTDVTELRTELKTDIAEVRTEVAGLRTELKGDIAELRIELKGDTTEVRTEVAGLRTDVVELKIAVARIEPPRHLVVAR